MLIQKNNSVNIFHTFLSKRGITEETAKRAGITLISNREAKKRGFPITCKSDAIYIPYFDKDGQPIHDDLGNQAARLRWLDPGDGPKYVSRTGAGIQSYIPPGFDDERELIIISEGELKSDAGVQVGLPIIGIQGCHCWHDSKKRREYERLCKTKLKPISSISMFTPIESGIIERIAPAGRPIKDVLILGDADLAWKETASDAKESLYKLRNAIALQIGAKAAVAFCPPVCELEWLAGAKDKIIEAVKASGDKKEIKAVERHIEEALKNKTTALKALANSLMSHAPALYEELKSCKTGLDDWLLYESKNGAVDNVVNRILNEAARVSGAVQVEYKPGRADETLPIIKEAVANAKDLNIYLLDDEVHCRVEHDRRGGMPKIRHLESATMLTEMIAQRIRLYKLSPKLGYQELDIPRQFLEIAAQTRGYKTPDGYKYLYPMLKGVQTLPIMNKDGSIQAFKNGYHNDYIWHIPNLDDILYRVPEKPADDDIQKAANLLFTPFQETPFADIESVSALFELLFTLATRSNTITAPAFLISSPAAGTGKTYLARIAAYLVTGETPDTATWPTTRRGAGDEEELRKLLVSLLLAKPSAVLFDNVPSGIALSSATLDMVITSPQWKSRLLGSNNYVNLATNTTFIFTGNNVALTGDTTSRFQYIRLSADAEDAYTRAYGRGQEEWIQWIDENRPALTAALLTLQRAFIQAGKTQEIARGLARQSRFQEWQTKARLPIIWLGSRGVAPTGTPLVDPEAAVNAHNIDINLDSDIRLLFSLHSVFKHEVFSVRDITMLLKKEDITEEEDDLLDAFNIDDKRNSRGVATRVGVKLAKLVGRWLRGLRLIKGGEDTKTHAALFRIESAPPHNPSPPHGPEDADGGAILPVLTLGPSSDEQKPEAEAEPIDEVAKAEVVEEAPAETPKALPAPKPVETPTAELQPAPVETPKALPTPAPIETATPEPKPAPFLEAFTDEHRALLHQAAWVSFDLETTALTKASAPITLTTQTKIGGTPWTKYKEALNTDADTTPRARILSVTIQEAPGGDRTTLAWDLDKLTEEEKSELFTLSISGKTLIGHNLTFDLSWAAWHTDAKPARVLDTMLLIRALWPSLPLALHEKAGCNPKAEKYVKDSKPGGIAGIGLEAVVEALGLRMPQGKAYQRPENWVPSALTLEHYEYATADTTIVLDILHRILKHFSISNVDVNQAWDALEAKNPPGWMAYRDAFAPAIPLLAGMHRLGLPLDVEGLQALLETKDKEARAHAEGLIKIIPELSPFFDQLISGGVSNGIKLAIVAYCKQHGIKLEVENQSKITPIRDAELEKAGDVENQADSSQKAVENTAKLPSISDDALIRAGANKLPFYPFWSGLKGALKIRQMLESIKGLAGIDGRLHSLIAIAADTGRTTSQKPNLQNFPRDSMFRALVRARSGHVIVDVDLSAIEMRVAAALAERAIKEFCKGGPRQKELPPWLLDTKTEPKTEWMQKKKKAFYAAVGKIAEAGYRSRLAEVFQAGVDPHVATALSVMRAAGEAPDVPEDVIGWLISLAPEERQGMKKKVGGWRQKAKALNFGLLYGQAAKGLYELGVTGYGLDWTLEEAEKAREIWLTTYPEIVLWQLVSVFAGSRRRLLTAKNQYSMQTEKKDHWIYSAKTLSGRPVTALATQMILNYQDQGSGAEMLLLAMTLLPQDLQKCIINIIHDEIMLEVPVDMAWRAKVVLEEAMVKAAEVWLQPWGVRAEAEGACGETWSDAKT